MTSIERLQERIERAIQEKVFPGCVVGIVRRNGHRQIHPFGRYTYESESESVKEDTIYDLASVTKSIPTFSLLLAFVDEGKLSLDDPIVKWLPQFDTEPGKRKVLVRHLLTFTLNLEVPSTSSLKEMELDDALALLFAAPLKETPGTAHIYTDSTGVIAGFLAAAVAKKPLDVAAQEYFFGPLGMHTTMFHPEQFPKERFAPTAYEKWRGRVLQGEVHDPASSVIHKKYIVGKAGLFSTANDLLTFMEMLLRGGEFNGQRYFSEEMVKQMYTEQIPHIDDEIGLGWNVHMHDRVSPRCGKSAFSRSGFTGTQVLCAPERGFAHVFLSNRTYGMENERDMDAWRSVALDVSDLLCEEKL